MFKWIKLTVKYLRDKDVSLVKKLLIIGGLLYLIFPVDVVPDFIVGLGIIDDITVISFIWFALRSELAEYGRGKEAGGSGKGRVIAIEDRRKD